MKNKLAGRDGRVSCSARCRHGWRGGTRHTLRIYDVPAKPDLKNLHYRNHQPYVMPYNNINNLKFNKNLINSPVTNPLANIYNNSTMNRVLAF